MSAHIRRRSTQSLTTPPPPPPPAFSQTPSPNLTIIQFQTESSLLSRLTNPLTITPSGTPTTNPIIPNTNPNPATSKVQTIGISIGLALTLLLILFLVCCVPQIANARRASRIRRRGQPQHKQLRMRPVRRSDSAQTLVGGVAQVGSLGVAQGWYHEPRVQRHESRQRASPPQEIADPVPPPAAYMSGFRPRR